MQKNSDKFVQLGTKIDPDMYEVLKKICDTINVKVYDLLQWLAYTVIRAASPLHSLDPRIQKIMTMLESDAGWQKAFNMANPNNLRVAQVILILEQQHHEGFGAVMIDKPFMGEARQTECVDDILERVTEVTMRGIYRRIRLLGASMECDNLSDVLLTMLDCQTVMNMEEGFSREMPQHGDRAINGKAIAYGKRTRRKKHITPDTMPEQRIPFADDQPHGHIGETLSESELLHLSGSHDDMSDMNTDTLDRDTMGFDPIGGEW